MTRKSNVNFYVLPKISPSPTMHCNATSCGARKAAWAKKKLELVKLYTAVT